MNTELHRETHFEREVCEALAKRGWIYGDAAAPDRPSDWQSYDRKSALYPDDLIAWLEDSQPEAWAKYAKAHGDAARDKIVARVVAVLESAGTLAALREEVKDVSHRFRLCQFKPASGLNPSLVEAYAKNRLRVVRQVHYSLKSENSIDLVLFVNGIPCATMELKTDFTQDVEDAMRQYRLDRAPAGEPLLTPKRGAVVHFAVSTLLVRMTTRLEGKATRFLPFDLGRDGGAGNPDNPAGGYRTAYFWESVLERESFLDVLGSFALVASKTEIDRKKGTERKVESVLFPRFHQMDAVRALSAAALAEGPGRRYLVQHSAGSGKTNTIAWLAHRLSTLHDAANARVFDAVVVVTDRTVLDDQLRDAIRQFAREKSVVEAVTSEQGAKSAKLAQALADGKSIIVCTIQTFPFALAGLRELASTKGRKFAVIADEAHSSQTGQAAAKLKKVLTAERLAEIEDGAEVDVDEVIEAELTDRADPKGISYFAFTATPKAKTMELFGRVPDPERPAGPDNLPGPFHVYTMQQAIEEGFILDVLRNYTPYKLAFRLATGGAEYDEASVEKSEALRSLMRWVRLHEHNVSQKVSLVVEHFRQSVAWRLGGKAKAMVVCSSRKEAVRWKLAMDRYLAERGYADMRAMVAFSGEVSDPESGPAPFSERGESMNPGLRGRNIREAFADDEAKVLIVANKFQTGFDQPLLCSMYVDKRLDGVQAVQTLSRLNRVHPGKDAVFVLDFVNDPEAILAAFRPYHRRAELSGVSDPNCVHDLLRKIGEAGLLEEAEILRCSELVFKGGAKQADLLRALAPAVSRFDARWKGASDRAAARDPDDQKEGRDAQNALLLWKADCATFLRQYDFLSQIFDYADTGLERSAVCLRLLLPLLKAERQRETVDLSGLILTHHALRNRGERELRLGAPAPEGSSDKLDPASPGEGRARESEKARLAEIVDRVNGLFEGEDLTDADKIAYVHHLRDRLLEDDKLARQAAANTRQQFSDSPDFKDALSDAIIGAFKSHKAMSEKAMRSDAVREGLAELLIDMVWQGFASKAEGAERR